jgi:ABC-type branched-subunit amino acid transport system permease subunit
MGDVYDEDSLTTPVEGAAEASAAEGATGPAVGRDEWVARHGERRFRRGGTLGAVEERLRTAPWWAWLTLFVALVALVPIGSESGYVRRVAFDTVLYMLLALGLNIVVGWGGLLDLGYVAFYGIGAYTYAVLNSDKYDIHLGAIPTMVVVLAIGAVAGFLVGLPSRRLSGDYLAIVTLFFLQIFLTITINSDSIRGENLLGGPNGILNVDPLTFFGREVKVSSEGIFNVAYLYIALAVFVVVYVALHFLNHSRTGRAWRSLREDPLAAELMGMPVSWLKLMSFAFGAAVAALTGVLLASLNSSVFPLTFSFPLLITIYTMVILGGSGSQAGVVLGAILISVSLEFLREPNDARELFYAVVLVAIVATFRVSWRLAIVLGSTFVFGLIAHAVAKAIDDAWVDGAPAGGGSLADSAADWVIVPTQLAAWITPVSYITLIVLILVLTLLRGWARLVVLVPTLYLAAFVWENVLLAKPEPTRFIVLGALLVVLMIARPNGLLGERRVEIV